MSCRRVLRAAADAPDGCRAAVVCSWRCRAAPTRWRCCTSCASSRQRGELAVAGAAHLQPPAARRRRRTRDEAFCRRLAGGARPADRGRRADVRAAGAREAAGRSRTRRGPRAMRFSSAAADRARRRGDCRGAQLRRSGRDVPAAAAPRRRAARARRHPAEDADRVVRPLIEISRAASCAPTLRHAQLSVSRGREQRRREHPAEPRPAPAAADAPASSRRRSRMCWRVKRTSRARTTTFSAGLQSIWPHPSS